MRFHKNLCIALTTFAFLTSNFDVLIKWTPSCGLLHKSCSFVKRCGLAGLKGMFQCSISKFWKKMKVSATSLPCCTPLSSNNIDLCKTLDNVHNSHTSEVAYWLQYIQFTIGFSVPAQTLAAEENNISI